jgi:hypothetical protein
MDPIATYIERRMDGRREFSLSSDEILVVGKRLLGANYEVRIPLKSIEPTISRLFIRSTFFLAGACSALGSTFICITMWSIEPSWLSFWPNWIFVATGIAGFVLAALTFKRVEFASFQSQAAVRVLDIARSGPERHKFDEFVNSVVRQIKAAQGMS